MPVSDNRRSRRCRVRRASTGNKSGTFIDPDTVLSLPVSPQSFQPVARRCSQIIEFFRDVQLIEFSSRDRPEVLRARAPSAFGVTAVINVGSALVGKGLNHAGSRIAAARLRR
jgi:hypothetical protein